MNPLRKFAAIAEASTEPLWMTVLLWIAIGGVSLMFWAALS